MQEFLDFLPTIFDFLRPATTCFCTGLNQSNSCSQSASCSDLPHYASCSSSCEKSAFKFDARHAALVRGAPIPVADVALGHSWGVGRKVGRTLGSPDDAASNCLIHSERGDTLLLRPSFISQCSVYSHVLIQVQVP